MSEWVYPIIVVLIAFDIAIGAVRVSMLNARPLRLMHQQESQPGIVQKTLHLIENPRLRANLRMSQTTTRFIIAFLVVQIIANWMGANQYLFLVTVISLIILAMIMLVIEFRIEHTVFQDPDTWAIRFSGFVRILMIVFTPFTFIPLLFLKPTAGHQSYAQITEDELKTWVESEEEPGSLEREERQMIYSIFQFGDTLTREIMIPRIDIIALEVGTSLNDAIQTFLESGHSRLPVYENTIDNVIGLLYAKDLLKSSTAKNDPLSLRKLLRPAYFVPETKKVDELLAEMQSQRIHMGLVVDEYGGVAGLVTLEDIVEEIVGEIRDEYDSTIEEAIYQELGENEYSFQGRIDLDDFNEIMNSELSKDESDTLAGYLYDHMGQVPQGGESIQVDGLTFTIEQVSGRRIRRIRVVREENENTTNDKTNGR
ncbi:MAG: hemolysin family protein [Anaerolineales bacterium]